MIGSIEDRVVMIVTLHFEIPRTGRIGKIEDNSSVCLSDSMVPRGTFPLTRFLVILLQKDRLKKVNSYVFTINFYNFTLVKPTSENTNNVFPNTV